MAEDSSRKSTGKHLVAALNMSGPRGRSKEIMTPANRIGKKYREEFNRSLISRSHERGQEKSLKKN